MNTIAHVESALHVDSIGDQLIYFGEESIGIENHSISNGASNARMQNSAGDLVKHEGLVANVHGMTRICPTLISHHPVGTLGDHVDELSLSLIPPLRTDDHNGAGLRIEHSIA
jgi:hypothetical protein